MLRSARKIIRLAVVCAMLVAERLWDNAIADRCVPLGLPRGGVTAHQHRSHGLSHPAAASKNPLYPDNGFDVVLHTSAPHPPNLSRRADVGDGIAVDQYEVGPSAGFDHASVV